MELHGEVSSGLGRAHVFMAQSHYQDQFRGVLGGTAWPGTLNIQVSDDDLTQYLALRQKAGIDTLDATNERRNKAQTIDTSEIDAIRIRGFLRDGRSFGGATAFKAQIRTADKDSIECAILIPDLTRHVEVIEVIAEAFLRESLDLTDGDRVSLNLI
ncbi:MAG: DUF120 domain-containing protein [Candidatus Thermoplasmatota archaeon]|nr:DUF120 domain-containing protein [Candidatus Thermoplasmatota archaeon]